MLRPSLVASLLLLPLTLAGLSGCGEEPDNSRWEDAQNRTTGGGVATADADDSDDLSDDDDDFPEVWVPPGTEPADDPAAGSGAVADASDLPDEGVDASNFNKFFPKQSGDYDMIARQEKGSTAIWDVERDETVLCKFSITDLAANPRALEKYRDAEMTIEGYPAVTQGSKTTALLVGGRYQVKALSQDDSFSAADREAWLKKFDLAGLAAMTPSAD